MTTPPPKKKIKNKEANKAPERNTHKINMIQKKNQTRFIITNKARRNKLKWKLNMTRESNNEPTKT